MNFWKMTVCASALISAGILGCSDSSPTEEVAGGVTDIGNSLAYSGSVVDAEGSVVASARVVAYYDSWDQSSIRDSVVTTTDENGKFEIQVDSGVAFVLYASHGSECGFAKVDALQSKQKISIGNRKNLTSSVEGKSDGFMRVVGNDSKALLHEDGSFEVRELPPGDISLVYVEDETPKARLEFTTTTSDRKLDIPMLGMWNANMRWLTISDPRYYAGEAFGGINVFVPTGIKLPEEPKEPEDTTDVEPLDTNSIRLHMDGDAVVHNSDDTVADSVNYVEGISGKAIVLGAGQFIDLGTIDPCAGDFTISVWTNWNGPTEYSYQAEGYQANTNPMGGFQGYGGFQNSMYQAGTNPIEGGYQGVTYPTTFSSYQVLFAQRSYWSDSTSRFQMQYDPTSKSLTVVSNGLDMATGYAWLAKADAEIGGLLPTNTWTFLTLKYKDGKLYFYVNGELASSPMGIAFVPKDVAEPVPFRIGGTELSTDTWNGAIDELTIDMFARSDESIKAEYEKLAK